MVDFVYLFLHFVCVCFSHIFWSVESLY